MESAARRLELLEEQGAVWRKHYEDEERRIEDEYQRENAAIEEEFRNALEKIRLEFEAKKDEVKKQFGAKEDLRKGSTNEPHSIDETPSPVCTTSEFNTNGLQHTIADVYYLNTAAERSTTTARNSAKQ